MNVWAALAPSAAILLSTLGVAFFAPASPPSGVVVQFSRAPTYALTQDAADPKQLFDGHIAVGTMWTSKDAVGWIADQRPIVIRADLGALKPLGRVCIRTARGAEAGVEFPASIDVFTSVDGLRFGWRGDAIGGDSGDGPYLARSFCTQEFDRRARLITLVVRTRGAYFFADEIELRPPQGASMQASEDAIPGDRLQAFVVERDALVQAATDLQTRLQRSGREEGADEVGRALQSIRTINGVAPTSLDIIRAAAGAACDVGAGAPTRIGVIRTAAYGDTNPLCPAKLEGAPVLELAPGWHRAASVWIANRSAEQRAVIIAPQLAGEAAAGLQVRLSAVRVVLAAPARLVGDALAPIDGRSIVVPAGEGRQVWVDVQAAPDASSGQAVLTFATASNGDGQTIEIPIRVTRIAEGPPPASTVWGYLDSIPIRDKPAEAVRDMLDHGVTTAVLPAADMPWPKRNGASSIGDYGRFDAAMSTLKGHRRFLFFLALNDPSEAAAGLDANLFSPAWQQRFVAWIREWSARLLRSGLHYDDFAMYPVDEPGSEAIRDRLVLLSRLIKSADPRIRVYTTLHRPEMLNDQLIQAVDIFQLNGAALAPETIGRLKRAGKILWSYETDGGGKAADPARFYRAQGWKAYLNGLDGFGFWAYADAGRSGSVWDDFDDVRPDFAVVYDGSNGILSSRRWEAWREGVQDYRLLVAAERAAGSSGRARVRGLAARGLQSIDDPMRLNAVIDELVQIASGKPLNSPGRSAMSGVAQGRAGRN